MLDLLKKEAGRRGLPKSLRVRETQKKAQKKKSASS